MAPPGRRFISLADVEPQTMEWVWENRIPRRALTVIEGDPGQGKSSLVHDVVARVTTGRSMPGCDGTAAPAAVVLLDAENDLAATLRPNLEAAGANLNLVRVFDRGNRADTPLMLPCDLGEVEADVAATQARLLIIDPLPAFLEGDVNSELSLRPTLARLTDFAERSGSAVLLIRHLNKSGPSNPLYRGAGSVAIIAAARSALLA